MARPLPGPGDLHVVTLTDLRPLDETNLRKLFSWVDEIPLSRPKKFINRDFSDGVMAAELIKHFLPSYVDMHNYSAASSAAQKEQNWLHLNRRVLRRLQLDLSINVIRAVADCTPWAIETVLGVLRHKINVRLSRSHGDWGSGDMGWLQEDGGSRNNEDRQHNTSNPVFVSGYSSPSVKYIPSAMDPFANSPRVHISKSKPTEKTSLQDNFVEMVPRLQLLYREKELAEKENKIQVLLAQVDRLESAIRLKDLLIGDLTSRVQQLAKYLGSSVFLAQQCGQIRLKRSQQAEPNLRSRQRELRTRPS